MRKYLIGVGNETMTDDGVGPRVARAVADHAASLGFEAVVSGHDTLGLLAYFEETTEMILFIDCARMGLRPGDWVCFSPDDVETTKPLQRFTTHEGDLLRIVGLASQMGGAMPRVTILGIEPESMEPGLALSPALQARFEEYLAAVRTEMARDA